MGKFKDYWVKSIGLAAKGKQAIKETLRDMPGLIELEKLYEGKKPLTGISITGCVSITYETAAFILLLEKMGALVRWCPDNRFASIDTACAYIASCEIPVFAKCGMTEEDLLWCFEKAVKFESQDGPTIIIDDGGDITHYLHGSKPAIYKGVLGTTEQTTCGITEAYKLKQQGTLLTAILNVNESVTKQKFDNIYGSRESLLAGIQNSLNIQIGGKQTVVFGFGETGKGCAMALRSLGAHVAIVEIDPVMAMMASMEGYELLAKEEACRRGNIFITATGCIKTIDGPDIELMKDGAILMNMGHGAMEINTQYLARFRKKKIGQWTDKHILKDGREIYLLTEGRLVNLIAGNGHPPRVMSITFTNHFLAIMELLNSPEKYKKGEIYRLPRILDETAAKLNFPDLQDKIVRLTPEQAAYLGVSVNGPFKREDYRY